LQLAQSSACARAHRSGVGDAFGLLFVRIGEPSGSVYPRAANCEPLSHLNSSVDYLPISIAKKEMTASCVLCLCVDLVVCVCEIALLLLFSALSEVIRGRVAAAVIIGWCTDSCVVVLWRNVKCLLGERERERERELASYLRIVRCVEREYEGLLLDGESFCTGFLVLIFVFGDGFW